MSAVPVLRRHAVLIAIFVLGLSLRTYHLSRYPRPNQTADEYAWTWAGLTMVTKGVPRSWSWLPAYQNAEMKSWRGHEYRVVQPWLDHPPLFALAMGVWMRSFGYRDPFWVDLTTMRAAMLVLFSITFFLLTLVLMRLTDRHTMLLTLLFFAVSPLVVFNGRLVVAENLFVPIHLAILYALLCRERPRWLPLIGVGALALPLTKVAAAAMSLHLAVVAFMRERRWATLVICGGTLFGVAAYWLYGRHFGPDLFWATIHSQAERFRNFDAFWELLFNHKIVEDRVPYFPFFLGLAVLLFETGPSIVWTALVLVYAGLIGFFADGSMVRGWYLVPLYPALCFGVARHVMTMWEEPGLRAKWIWIAFILPGLAMRLIVAHGDHVSMIRYSYLGIVVAAAVFFAAIRTVQRGVAGKLTIVLVAAQVLSDISFVITQAAATS